MKKQLLASFQPTPHMISENYEIQYYEGVFSAPVKLQERDYYEFYFFLQADLCLYINEHPFPIKSEDIVLIMPGTPLSAVNLDVSQPCKCYIFRISADYFHLLQESSPDYGYIVTYAQKYGKYVYHSDVTGFNAMQAVLLHLMGEVYADRFGRETKLPLTIHGLILNLSRMAYEQNHPKQNHKNVHLYEATMLYIESHLEDDLSLDHLADVLYSNKYYIAHTFKENMGLSIHQYILKKRLALCCEAFLNHSNISDIYQLYGFKDYSSFYRAFKKEYGVSPKVYKKQQSLGKNLLP